MIGSRNITIREVEASDLENFFEHQLDPEAKRMAAFVCDDPTHRAAFDAHWKKNLNSPGIMQRTIVSEEQFAGHIACFPDGENLEVTFWLGRQFWGRGIATRALERMLHLVAVRPIFARAAADNTGSLRVLEKSGFKIIGKNKDFANGRGEDTEEFILRLDGDQATG
jgi:RimJ/RimL family protein N-acetyltransferase